MIDETLKQKILSNKIEITEDNFEFLMRKEDIYFSENYNRNRILNNFKSSTEILDRHGINICSEYLYSIDTFLSSDFYYITERDLFIVDFSDKKTRSCIFYKEFVTRVVENHKFGGYFIFFPLSPCKLKWFYPKEIT